MSKKLTVALAALYQNNFLVKQLVSCNEFSFKNRVNDVDDDDIFRVNGLKN
jgi:hypothetical protein